MLCEDEHLDNIEGYRRWERNGGVWMSIKGKWKIHPLAPPLCWDWWKDATDKKENDLWMWEYRKEIFRVNGWSLLS